MLFTDAETDWVMAVANEESKGKNNNRDGE
jgi:hypothetical protein